MVSFFQETGKAPPVADSVGFCRRIVFTVNMLSLLPLKEAEKDALLEEIKQGLFNASLDELLTGDLTESFKATMLPLNHVKVECFPYQRRGLVGLIYSIIIVHVWQQPVGVMDCVFTHNIT